MCEFNGILKYSSFGERSSLNRETRKGCQPLFFFGGAKWQNSLRGDTDRIVFLLSSSPGQGRRQGGRAGRASLARFDAMSSPVQSSPTPDSTRKKKAGARPAICTLTTRLRATSEVPGLPSHRPGSPSRPSNFFLVSAFTRRQKLPPSSKVKTHTDRMDEIGRTFPFRFHPEPLALG